MPSFLFKSLMLVLLVSYVCSVYISIVKGPELPDKTIFILETMFETKFNHPDTRSEPLTTIKLFCLNECQNIKIPEEWIEFCMENCNKRLINKLEEDGFNFFEMELE